MPLLKTELQADTQSAVTAELNGEYAICWKDDNVIFMGPEQVYGTICSPFNLFYDSDLEVVKQFITDNNLT